MPGKKTTWVPKKEPKESKHKQKSPTFNQMFGLTPEPVMFHRNFRLYHNPSWIQPGYRAK